MSADKLSKKIIDELKPESKGRYRVADGKSLYLEVTPAGGKFWRFVFRMKDGKQRTMTLGSYPEVTVANARKMRDEARVHVALGRNPIELRHVAEGKSKDEEHLFRNVAQEWMSNRRASGMSEATLQKDGWIVAKLNLSIGDKDVRIIRPRDLIAAIKPSVDAGHGQTVNDTRFRLAQIFRFAIANELCDMNPAASIRDALPSPKGGNYAAIFDRTEFGELMRSADRYSGWDQTRLCLQLSFHVFLRSGEVRRLQWSHWDKEARMLSVPGSIMKNGRDHLVPLSDEAVRILEEAEGLFGSSRLMFPSSAKGAEGDLPLSENTLNKAIQSLGFGKRVTFHGLRQTASTMLNESGKFEWAWIERQLDHHLKGIAGVYNKAQYIKQRTKMMQWWSSEIKRMKSAKTAETT